MRSSDHLFATQSWITKRFYNPTARSVRDFDPTRAHGKGNDYRPTDNSHPDRHGAFLWGRPAFGGIHKAGRDAQLYLAWVPMPSYAEDGRIGWKPQFYAGLAAAGHPRFVEREVDSVPLDLDAAQSGEQPGPIACCSRQSVPGVRSGDSEDACSAAPNVFVVAARRLARSNGCARRAESWSCTGGRSSSATTGS